jgi:hypothetical protein
MIAPQLYFFIEFAAQQWTLTSDVPILSVYAVCRVVDEQSFSHAAFVQASGHGRGESGNGQLNSNRSSQAAL